MKHLKLFQTEAEYTAYKDSEDFVLPNVSYTIDNKKTSYNPLIQSKNGVIYATFNATSDNMTAIYDTSNVKSLIVDDREIFDMIESITIINIIGENITMNDNMQTGAFPEEYCYMLSNGLPSSWTFKPTNASIDECDYIALIGIVGGQMTVSPMPINTGIEQGFFTYDDINNVFCISESLLGQMSQGGIEGLNFVCMSVDEVNGTFAFLDTVHDIKFLSGSKPTNYIFDSEGNHTMEIELIDNTVIPQAMFFGNDYPQISSCITTITIPDSVTYIGSNAFNGCLGLTKVTIGSGVTSIGEKAFYDCSGLTGELVIPDSVTSIGDSAFEDCSNLTSIEIGSGVTSIGDSAFYDCSGLTGELVIPDSVTSIGSNVFGNCSSLTSIEIGSGVTSIVNRMCFYCTSLTSITIPDSVTSIEKEAFYYCTSLTSITIPDSVIYIGSKAFDQCISLPIINNIRYADTCLLYATDTTLTTYNIKEGTKFIGNSAFSHCSNLTSITIPDSVTSIGDWVFYNCTGLKSITIPDSVTSIGDYVFKGCTNLTSITIPDSVTSIGEQAFRSCSGLTSITIPDSVTSIGKQAFYYCSGLTSITCLATTPPSISRDTFQNVKTNGILKVPTGSDYSSWMRTSNYYLGKYNWTIEYI